MGLKSDEMMAARMVIDLFNNHPLGEIWKQSFCEAHDMPIFSEEGKRLFHTVRDDLDIAIQLMLTQEQRLSVAPSEFAVGLRRAYTWYRFGTFDLAYETES